MKIVASVLLIILPFSTLLSSFSPYLSPHSFKDYLIASFIYALVLILLALYLSSNRIRENLKKRKSSLGCFRSCDWPTINARPSRIYQFASKSQRRAFSLRFTHTLFCFIPDWIHSDFTANQSQKLYMDTRACNSSYWSLGQYQFLQL